MSKMTKISSKRLLWMRMISGVAAMQSALHLSQLEFFQQL